MRIQTAKHKLIAGLLALMMMLSLISVPAIAERREQITPQSQSAQFIITAPNKVERGEQFDVVVSISGVYQASGLTLDFPFDEGAFEFVGVSKGAVLLDGVQAQGGQAVLSYDYNADEGRNMLVLGVAMSAAGQTMTMEGELFTLTLKAKVDAADGAYTMAPVVTEFIYMPYMSATSIPYTISRATVAIGMINEAVFAVTAFNKVERGEQFDVVVSISGTYQMHGLHLNFPFDENNFEYVSVKKGAVIVDAQTEKGATVMLAYEYNEQAGKNLLVLGVSAPYPDRPITMAGELFTVTLRAKNDAADNVYTMAPVVNRLAYMPNSVAQDIPFTTVPTTVTIDSFPENVYTVNNGTQIVLGKDAYLTADGTYTIDLSAYTVGTPVIQQRTAKVPVDYILVFDASASMKDTYSCQLHDEHVWNCYHISAARAAANAFVDELRADSTTFAAHPEWNLDSRIAVVSYATADGTSQGVNYYYNGTGIYKTDKGADSATFYKYARNGADPADMPLAASIYDDAFMSVVDELDEAHTAINDIELHPYTAMHLGMEMAKGIIEATAARTTDSQDDHYNKYYDQEAGEWKVRPKVVLLFTDGVSGNIGYSNKSVAESIQHANAIKATGATIYTIGLVSTTMFTQHGDCWQDEFGKYELTGAYGGTHKGIGEFQVNNYAFEEFTNASPTPLKNRNNQFFGGFEKLKQDLNITTDEEAIRKYIELQKNQYRIMGLTRGFLYKDALMAISSEYDHIDVSLEDERAAVNNNGKTCDWVMYDANGNLIQWYSTAPALDLKVDGQRIGARYGLMMTSVLKADGSIGTNYPSADAIWKKMYQTTTENLLTYDPADNTYKYMDVEVPVVTQEAGYINSARQGYEYAANPNLKYYIPLENAADEGEGLGRDNIRRLIEAFKHIEEVSVSVQVGNIANTGMSKYSAITDKISDSFTVPDNFSVENNIEFWLVPVDNDAMHADPMTNGSNVNRWIFGTPENRSDGAVLIGDNASTDNDIEAAVYGQSTFKGGVKYDPANKTITIVGFRWAHGSWYCKYNETGDTYAGWKMIVRIKGLTANDDAAINTDINTNDKNFSGMRQNWRDTRPATLQTTDGVKTLLFPEPTVNLRNKYVVYDYGFRLEDSKVNGFFGEEGEISDVARLLAVDYMYRDQKQNGAINYRTQYPYVGATGKTADGRPMTYETQQSVNDALFEIGVSGGKAYFEPHSIAKRDYQVAALLELNGTQSDVFGNNLKRYVWSKLVFVPATNVLYEAEQGVDASNPTILGNKKQKLEGDFGVFYSGREKSTGNWAATAAWSVDGTALTDSAQEHYNKRYGYDPVYDGQLAQYANGAAMKVSVNEELYRLVNEGKAQWPVAKFTFEGSGFSFNTVCSLNTGIFAVDVVPHGQPASTDTGDGGTCLHTFVNTRYYGATDPNSGEEGALTIGATTLYQVPVMRYAHMTYGVYDVYITPVFYPAWAEIPGGTKGMGALKDGQVISDFPGLEAKNYTVVNAVDNGGADIAVKGEAVTEFTCYIDTFRVYHPRGAMVHKKNIDAQEYYAADEMNAKYVEVRNIILGGIEDIANDTEHGFNGAIFIDYGPTDDQGGHINDAGFDPADPNTFTAKAYTLLGPNNEMYLPTNGNFTFNVANPTRITNLHLSAKALTGDAAQMKITYLYSNASGKQEVEFTRDVLSATEMYYDIGRANAGDALLVDKDLVGISIECTAGTLSLINIKIVYDKGYSEGNENASVHGLNIVGDIHTVEAANVVAFGIKGDVNFDGEIDLVDAILVMRATLGIESFGTSARYCANFDRNGTVDLADVIGVIRCVLGIK